MIEAEMLATRIIPIGDAPHWPKAVEGWMGDSRAHWEGKTLVIETTNIKSGDSVSRVSSKRSASPVIVTMVGGAPLDTTPTSPEAKTVERLTMTGPNSLMHELTYWDPQTHAAPWTARTEWTRDDGYRFYEYACHEGDMQIRNDIIASRAERAARRRRRDAGGGQPRALHHGLRPRPRRRRAGGGGGGGWARWWSWGRRVAGSR